MRVEWVGEVYVILRVDNKTIQGVCSNRESADWIIENELKDLPYEYIAVRKDQYIVR
jgi:hypothetical protein